MHHIQPWIRRSIADAEERLERKMVQQTEQKIGKVHQLLDTFQTRVLARPSPPVDVSTLQAAVESLRADINMILEARVPKFEAPSVEPVEDIVMAVVFATSEIQQHQPQEDAKRRKG